MYFWKTQLLVADLKRGALGETDFKNYYLAASVLATIFINLALLEPRANMFALVTEAIGSLVITILGLNAAFRGNGGANGSRFLEKAVSISFPLLIKVLVASLAIGVLSGIFEVFGVGKNNLEWVYATATIAVQGVFFRRLFIHMRNTNV